MSHPTVPIQLAGRREVEVSERESRAAPHQDTPQEVQVQGVCKQTGERKDSGVFHDGIQQFHSRDALH